MDNSRLNRELQRLEFSQAGRKTAVKENIVDISDNNSEVEDEMSQDNSRLNRELQRLEFSQAGRKAAVKENIVDISDNNSEVEDEMSQDDTQASSMAESTASSKADYTADFMASSTEAAVMENIVDSSDSQWWSQEAIQKILEKVENKIISKRKASEMLGVPYHSVASRMINIENENESNPKKFKSKDGRDQMMSRMKFSLNKDNKKCNTPLTDDEAAQLLCMSLTEFRSQSIWENINKNDPSTKVLLLCQIGEYKEVRNSGKPEDVKIWWYQPMVRKIMELYKRNIIKADVAADLLGVPIEMFSIMESGNNYDLKILSKDNKIERILSHKTLPDGSFSYMVLYKRSKEIWSQKALMIKEKDLIHINKGFIESYWTKKSKEQKRMDSLMIKKVIDNSTSSSQLSDAKKDLQVSTCENDQEINDKNPQSTSKSINSNEKKCSENDDDNDSSDDDNDNEIYKVDKILSHRKHNSKIQYLIAWEGYSIDEATWEPKENLVTCLQLINDYHIKLQNGQRTDVECDPLESNDKSTQSASKRKSASKSKSANKFSFLENYEVTDSSEDDDNNTKRKEIDTDNMNENEKITEELNESLCEDLNKNEKIIKVLNERICDGETQYLVQWQKSKRKFAPSWEKISLIPGFQDALKESLHQRNSEGIQNQIRKEMEYYSKNETSTLKGFTNWLFKNNEGDYACKYCSEESYPLGQLSYSRYDILRNKYQKNKVIFLLQSHALGKKHLEHVRQLSFSFKKIRDDNNSTEITDYGEDDDDDNDNDHWEVDRILSHRKRASHIEYLIAWEGFSIREATWEPEANLVTCLQMIKDYHREIKDDDRWGKGNSKKNPRKIKNDFKNNHREIKNDDKSGEGNSENNTRNIKDVDSMDRRDEGNSKNNTSGGCIDLLEINFTDEENTRIVQSFSKSNLSSSIDIQKGKDHVEVEEIKGKNEENGKERYDTKNQSQRLEEVSGFMLWAAKLHEFLPKNNSFQLTGIEQRQWNKMPDDKRQHFHDLAHDINITIQQLMEGKFQDSSLLTGYVLFSAEKRRELISKNPEADGVQLSVLPLESWNRLTKKKQDQYQKRALAINYKLGFETTPVSREYKNKEEETTPVQQDEYQQTPGPAPTIEPTATKCICGLSGNWYNRMLECQRCKRWFHEKCVGCLQYKLICGDMFYLYVCEFCNNGREFLHRLPLRWDKIVHLALWNLSNTKSYSQKYFENQAHFNEEDITMWVRIHWELLQCPPDLQKIPLRDRTEHILLALHGNAKKYKCWKSVSNNTRVWTLKVPNVPSVPEIILPPESPITSASICRIKYRKRTTELTPIPKSFKIDAVDLSLQLGSPTLVDLDIEDDNKITKQKLADTNYLQTDGKTILTIIKSDGNRNEVDPHNSTTSNESSGISNNKSGLSSSKNSSSSISTGKSSNNISSSSKNLSSGSPCLKISSKGRLKIETIMAHEGSSESPQSYLVQFCRVGKEVKFGWIGASKMSANQHYRDLLVEYWDNQRSTKTSESISSSNDKLKKSMFRLNLLQKGVIKKD